MFRQAISTSRSISARSVSSSSELELIISETMEFRFFREVLAERKLFLVTQKCEFFQYVRRLKDVAGLKLFSELTWAGVFQSQEIGSKSVESLSIRALHWIGLIIDNPNALRVSHRYKDH